jgi:hypothetical protein
MGRREECALAEEISLGRRRRRHNAGTDDLLHLRSLGGRPPGCLGEQVLGCRSRHGCSSWDCNGRAKTWRVCAWRVSVIGRVSAQEIARVSAQESWSSVHADQLSSAELVPSYGPFRRGGEPVGQVAQGVGGTGRFARAGKAEVQAWPDRGCFLRLLTHGEHSSSRVRTVLSIVSSGGGLGRERRQAQSPGWERDPAPLRDRSGGGERGDGGACRGEAGGGTRASMLVIKDVASRISREGRGEGGRHRAERFNVVGAGGKEAAGKS